MPKKKSPMAWFRPGSYTVLLLFVFVFFLGKGSQFAIPIILGNVLKPDQYGAVELSMSVGLIIISVGSMGSSAFISRSIVKEERWINLDAVKLFLVGLSAVFIMSSLLMHYMNSSLVTKLALAFSSVLLLQGAMSAEFKSRAKRKSAIIIDITLWTTILIWAFLYIIWGRGEAYTSLLWLVFFHYLILLVLFGKSIASLKLTSPLRVGRYFSEGSRIVVMGFISVLVATSGRLVVGDNLGISAVGEYSSLYRLSILPIIAHQMIMLYFYRTSFSESREKFVYLGTIAFVIISIISLVTWLLAPFFAPYLGLLFESSLRSHPMAFSALMISVPFWSAISINELAYSQNVKSRIPLLCSFSYVLLAYLMTSYSMVVTNLDSVSASIALMIIGYYFVNSVSLAKVGVPVAKLPILCSICMVIIVLSYLLKTTV